MRKIVFYLFSAFVLATLVASCDFFRKGDPVGAISEVDVDYLHRDSTLYGVCGRATSMNSLQLITDLGDTLMLSIAEAQDAGQVFGGIKAGERMAVLANADSTIALKVINMSAMLGDWVTEDAVDGGNEVAITLKDGGIAESINHTLIQYKSWRIINGQLEIVNTRDDGGDFEEIYLYNITFIGPDSLVFQNDEDKYEYTRQKPQEEVDLGFELEESNFEDFVF